VTDRNVLDQQLQDTIYQFEHPDKMIAKITSEKGGSKSSKLKTALEFARYLKSHAKRVYRSVHGLDSQPARTLAKRLLERKLPDDFTQRNVLHKGWANLSTKDKVNLAVTALVERGWLSEHPSELGGRKTTRYKINPGISEVHL
jgi:hypothetical protein